MKLIKADINIGAYIDDIMTPDKRYRSGFRKTGFIEAKSRVTVTLFVEQEAKYQVGDMISTVDLGTYRIVRIDKFTREMKLLSASINTFEHRQFTIGTEIQINGIFKVYREGSMP